jgi:large subunit ribosomal protein L35
MPKLKTHRGAAKRFRRTATGKFLRSQAFKQHLLTGKSRHRKRRLRRTTVVTGVEVRKLKRMLPYR